MRLLSFVAVSLVLLAACQEPESRIGTTVVHWMDWPAEVAAGQPFTVRMIVTRPCAAGEFRDGSSADQSAVTFAPYFLDVRDDVLCARTLQSVDLVVGGLDTIGRAPALPAEFSRSYEMRGSAYVAVPDARSLADLPVRTFGEVVVRTANLDASRRNAGGDATIAADELGCLRIHPLMTFGLPGTPLADQASTVPGGFVRGFYADAAEPMCGESRVFHVVSVN